MNVQSYHVLIGYSMVNLPLIMNFIAILTCMLQRIEYTLNLGTTCAIIAILKCNVLYLYMVVLARQTCRVALRGCGRLMSPCECGPMNAERVC